MIHSTASSSQYCRVLEYTHTESAQRMSYIHGRSQNSHKTLKHTIIVTLSIRQQSSENSVKSSPSFGLSGTLLSVASSL